MIRTVVSRFLFPALLVAAGLAFAQDDPRRDMPLPGRLPPAGVLPDVGDEVLPKPRQVPKDSPLRKNKIFEDTDLVPRKGISKGPLGPPPKLGEELTPGTRVGQAGGNLPLTLPEVLETVAQHFPQIAAAEQERDIAEGLILSAQGAFDLNIRSPETFIDGTYDSQRYGLFLDQFTPYNGVSVFGGYRLGSGQYPVYYGDRKTADAGEFRAGAMIPLLRNRLIDRQRASLAKAGIDRQIAEPSIHGQRLDISRAASRVYWLWVAAGQRLFIARDILRIALDRDDFLGRRVKAGDLAIIDQVDNRRIIVERQARVVAAERSFQAASIALSLYYRDVEGKPTVLTQQRLPNLIHPVPPPDLGQRTADLEAALLRRPELAMLYLAKQKIMVDLDLADNQTLPGLSVGVAGYQDVGFGKRSPQSTSPLDRAGAELSVNFDVPLQRREARGRILVAKAEIARLTAREVLARDRIQLEVQDTINALDRAYDLLKAGRDNRRQADYLAEAERRLFDLGLGDLFRVNIRELQAAEARTLEVDAAAEYFRSLADYNAALGFDTSMSRN